MYDIVIHFEEPIKLIGSGEYNLNVLKEIKVTESFFALDQEERQCQNKYSVHDCTTDHHFHTILNKCGCLPLKMGVWNKVVESYDN